LNKDGQGKDQCEGLDCLKAAEKDMLMSMANSYSQLYNETKAFEHASLEEFAW
jgi:hypothetical protein